MSVFSHGNPSHGTLTVSPDGSFAYTPSAGYQGTDLFDYTIADTAGRNATGTVEITVTPPGTTAPGPSAATTLPPSVVSVARVRSHHAMTGLIVTYSSGIGLSDPASADHYAVSTVVKRGKARVQRIRSVAYDPVAHVVKITLAKKLAGHPAPKLKLSITGVLSGGPYSAIV